MKPMDAFSCGLDSAAHRLQSPSNELHAQKIASNPGERINWTDQISSSNMRKTIYVIKPLALESACPQRVSFLVREKILPL
jgi:hypothetical protein